MSERKRGLIVGRFQPFHKGHLFLVKDVLKECQELIIVIGSSQFNFTFSNPFTAGERILMIHDSLDEESVDSNKIFMIPMINLENNSIWIHNVKSMVPEFDVIYSGNKFVSELVQRELPNLVIKSPNFLIKKDFNGTNIRTRIVEDKEWTSLVPNAISRILNKINGIQRIKMLYDTTDSLANESSQYPNIK